MSFASFLLFTHLVGLALGVGGATVKLVALLRSARDRTRIAEYFAIAKPVTRQIIAGIILLTVSGIAWLVAGYPLTPKLVVKVAMVAAIFVLGPIIDNVVEPKFRTLALAGGVPASPELVRVQKQYLVLEVTATGLFYAVIVLWVLL